MAPKAYTCPSPGCDYATDTLEAELAIRFLEIHVAQAHGVTSKPEKPKKPDLEMIGNVVDALDWETFIHKFDTYKKLAGISGDGGSHLLACLSKDVYYLFYLFIFITYSQLAFLQLFTGIYIWLTFTRSNTPLEICRWFPQFVFTLHTRVRPIKVGILNRFFLCRRSRTSNRSHQR